jgi:hypothetical protein
MDHGGGNVKLPADKFSELMEKALCRRCEKYHRGCKPGEIIECTKFMMARLDELNKRHNGEYELIKNGVLKAVHTDDLKGLLTSLKEWEQFSAGDCRCRFCDQVMTVDNLYAIIPWQRKEIAYSCGEAKCVLALSENARRD